MNTLPYQWQLDKLKIIFVESDRESTDLFVNYFTEDFTILAVSSAEEALEIFSRETDIAMILTDQALPGMSGIDLLSHVYQHSPEVIRIIITGYLGFSDTIDAINKGHIYQFILKPWDVVQMRMILSQAAQTWVLTKENSMLHDQVIEQNRKLIETNQQCKVSEHNLRNLSTALLNAREDEQKRIAMELHDELGQSLAALKLQIRVMKNEFPGNDQVAVWLDKFRADINEIIENVRRLSRNLSPVIIDDLGLDAALESIVESFSKASGITCTFKQQSLGGIKTFDGQRLVYRLVQESLNNIGKHAQATHIDFTISVDGDMVTIELTDNGKGFDVEKNVGKNKNIIPTGIGLTAMVHRAAMLGGTATIDSKIGKGSTVRFSFPLNTRIA
jgi:signal transduction histidine kinase